MSPLVAIVLLWLSASVVFWLSLKVGLLVGQVCAIRSASTPATR
jgi:hypothetical protein